MCLSVTASECQRQWYTVYAQATSYNMFSNHKIFYLSIQSTPAPCGVVQNCTGKADGLYPDYTRNCTGFYVCNRGNFHFFQYCPEGFYQLSNFYFVSCFSTCIFLAYYIVLSPKWPKECSLSTNVLLLTR